VTFRPKFGLMYDIVYFIDQYIEQFEKLFLLKILKNWMIEIHLKITFRASKKCHFLSIKYLCGFYWYFNFVPLRLSLVGVFAEKTVPSLPSVTNDLVPAIITLPIFLMLRKKNKEEDVHIDKNHFCQK